MAVILAPGARYYGQDVAASNLGFFMPYYGVISFLIRTPAGPTALGDCTFFDQVTPPGALIGAISNTPIFASNYSRSLAAGPTDIPGHSRPPYSSGLWFGLRDGQPSMEVFDGRYPNSVDGGMGVLSLTSDTVLEFDTCYTISYVMSWDITGTNNTGGSEWTIYLGNTVASVEQIAYRTLTDLTYLGALSNFWQVNNATGGGISMSIGSASDPAYPTNESGYAIGDICAWTTSLGQTPMQRVDFLGDWVPNILNFWHANVYPSVMPRAGNIINAGFHVHFYSADHIVFDIYSSSRLPGQSLILQGTATTADECYGASSGSPAASPSTGTPTPIPPPPVPPHPTPTTPCTPHSPTGNGGNGNSGCNTGGVGGTPSYNGPWGTVPQHPDPIPGESMINAQGVDLWVEIVHTDYPSGDQTVYRRAMVDLADPPSYEGGRKAGGLMGVGDVEHGLGNEQGGFEAATVDISYADSADRLFRNLLADQELEGDEVRIKMATPAGRAASVAPRVLARSVAQKPRLTSALNASFSASDYLFSEFGPFGPGRQFPSSMILESVFPYAPVDSLKLPLPVFYGEKSDEGAKDPLTGIVSPKGLVPLIYVGPASLGTTGTVSTFPPNDPGLDTPPDSEVVYLAHPMGELSFQAVLEHATLDRYDAKLYVRDTVAPVIATLNIGLPTPDAGGICRVDIKDWLNGQSDGDYDVTVTAVQGVLAVESAISNAFTVPLSPENGTGGWGGPINADPFFAVMAVFNGKGSRLVLKSGPIVPYTNESHDFRVTWTEAPQASEYWIFMYTGGSPWDAYVNPYATANVRYQRLPATPTNSRDADWDYYVDWTSPSDGESWPPATTTTNHPDVWDTYIIAGHAIFDILTVYGSDLGLGVADAQQNRIRLDPNSRGDMLCPFFGPWPFPTTYRDFTSEDGSVYRMTVAYVRGPLSQAHKDGIINLTVNAIGIEDVGDGSGLPLTDAHAVQQHWIENFLINNWRTGPWVTNTVYPRWEDGTPMVRSSSFAELQAMGQSRLGGRGLTVGWYAADQRVLQDWFQEWNRSTDSRLGINGDGQILVAGLDENVDTVSWPHIHHEIDLFGDVVWTSGEERENVVSGICDWDPDKKQWRGQTVTYERQQAITQYKGRRKEGTKIESTILTSERQLRWVLLRRLTRLQDGTKTVEITGKIDLLDYDVGTGILLNTIEGTGEDGFVNKPMLILRRRFKVSDRLVTLTLLDLDTFMIPLELQFIIGDDTVSVATGPLISDEGLVVGV